MRGKKKEKKKNPVKIVCGTSEGSSITLERVVVLFIGF